MSKGTWILGAIVGFGFFAESREVSELQDRLRELEDRSAAATKPVVGKPPASSADSEIARQVGQLQDEVGRIYDRLKALDARPPAAVPEPAPALAAAVPTETDPAAGDDGEAAAPAEAAPEPLSPELLALLTPENRKILTEAIGHEMDVRMKKEKERQRKKELAERWASIEKNLGLNPSQEELLKPIFQSHFKQLDALKDKLGHATPGERPVIGQQIAVLRQTMEARIQPYLAPTQLPKMWQMFNGGSPQGTRSQPGVNTHRSAPAPGLG